MLEPPRWIGWGNYIKLLLEDDIFIISLRNTLLFAVITGPVSYLLCLLFAWIINEFKPRVRSVLTLIFYAPSICGNAYMVWNLILTGDRYGYLNGLLLRLDLINEPILWMQTEKYVMPVLIVVQLWLSLGTGFLSFVAGFTNVDKELYDAAAVDGVTSRFQRLIYVDIPQTMPQLLFAAVLQITGSLSVGGTLAGHPTPEDAGLTVMLHLSDYSGTRFEVGYASAIAVVLSLLIFGLGRAAFKILGDKG